jgi:hypothetical protein
VFLSFIVLVIPTPQAEESCSHSSWAHTISTPLKSRARADKYLGAGQDSKSERDPVTGRAMSLACLAHTGRKILPSGVWQLGKIFLNEVLV